MRLLALRPADSPNIRGGDLISRAEDILIRNISAPRLARGAIAIDTSPGEVVAGIDDIWSGAAIPAGGLFPRLIY